MAEYRLIVKFEAPNGKAAQAKADAAAKQLGGKIDRLTERRETWGAVKDDEQTA
jgi:hypothetical protein